MFIIFYQIKNMFTIINFVFVCAYLFSKETVACKTARFEGKKG